MTDRYQTDPFNDEPLDPFDSRPRETTRSHPPLPAFLARRVLRPDEQVAWVAGPRFNPSWEQYVTHPLLILAAIGLGVVLVLLGLLFGASGSGAPLIPIVVALLLPFVALITVAFFCGYFTRLVVTNARLVIIQGREVCRSWDARDLPPSLLRYRMRMGEDRMGDDRGPTIDLDAVKTMLGGSSDQFVDARSILAFGKEINRGKGRDDRRP